MNAVVFPEKSKEELSSFERLVAVFFSEGSKFTAVGNREDFDSASEEFQALLDQWMQSGIVRFILSPIKIFHEVQEAIMGLKEVSTKA